MKNSLLLVFSLMLLLVNFSASAQSDSNDSSNTLNSIKNTLAIIQCEQKLPGPKPFIPGNIKNVVSSQFVYGEQSKKLTVDVAGSPEVFELINAFWSPQRTYIYAQKVDNPEVKLAIVIESGNGGADYHSSTLVYGTDALRGTPQVNIDNGLSCRFDEAG